MVRSGVVIALGAVWLSMAGIARAADTPEVPAPPADGQPVITAAVLQGLDKTTARVTTFDAPLGQTVHFGTLEIVVRDCRKRPPEETPERAAFLDIQEAQPGEAAAKPLFSGWMFASSPAVSALEHPVYDVRVLDCKTATGSSPKKG